MVNTQSISKLPQELIIEILALCDGATIRHFAEAVSHQNGYIWELIRNEKLWKNAEIPAGDQLIKFINIRSPRSICTSLKFIKYLGNYTTSLTIGNIQSLQWNLSEPLMRSLELSCTSLKSLTIINCEMDTNVLKLSMLPKTISHLKFVYVTMPNREKPMPIEQIDHYIGHAEELRKKSVYDSPFYQVKASLPNLSCIEVEASNFYIADIVAASLGNMSIRTSGDYLPNLEVDHMRYKIIIEEDPHHANLNRHSRFIGVETMRFIKLAVDKLKKYISLKNLDQFFNDQDIGKDMMREMRLQLWTQRQLEKNKT